MEDDEELYEDEFFMSRTCKCYGCTKINCDHRLKIVAKQNVVIVNRLEIVKWMVVQNIPQIMYYHCLKQLLH